MEKSDAEKLDHVEENAEERKVSRLKLDRNGILLDPQPYVCV